MSDQTSTRPEPVDDGLAEVVLVDAGDREIGLSTKLAAHEPPGALHRAMSAFVFNDRGQLLLQRRAATKYHFAGLWSNSCCTHPRPGESVVQSGERRVREELGLECHLVAVGSFRYRAVDLESGLVEEELDHVLTGTATGEPSPDPAEVDEIAYTTLDDLHRTLAAEPHRFTPWLSEALQVLGTHPTRRSS